MVPPTTTSSSKPLNPLAPEYCPKTLAAVAPEPPQFVSPFLSASPQPFFPPPSNSLASPSFFCHPYEFYMPALRQPSADISTYYCYPPPENPYSGPSTMPPTNYSSAAVPPSGGFTSGNEHVRRSVPKEENRHVVLSLDEENTTIMLKNIPYDCPREYLLEFLDRFCAKCIPEEQINASYDFLYLPIDFKTRKSRGFAFFNFTTAAAAWKFFDTFNSMEWDPLKWSRWPKKMEIARAKIQGREALITHFSNSTFECVTDEYLPVSFNPPRDGSGQHVEVKSVGKRIRRAIPHWEPRAQQSLGLKATSDGTLCI